MGTHSVESVASSDERLQLLAEVATLYYEDGLTQNQIAQRLDLSRSSVSRLLSEARQSGVVEITIHYPWQTMPTLQGALVEHFHLRTARVLDTRGRDYPHVLQGLGQLAARYLEGVLQDSMILGIGWGTAIHAVAEALSSVRQRNIKVVQIIGAVGMGNPLIDGPDLARWVAQKLGGHYHYLHAPLVVKSAALREALLQEPHIRETMDVAGHADIALVGIGSVAPGLSSLVRAGYLNDSELAEVRAAGAVGDVCARHFDQEGRVLPIPLNRRVVGIDLENLKRIGCVIGVAGGTAKAPAILGALRGGFLDVLVTDDRAAQELLRLDGAPEQQLSPQESMA